MDTNIKRHKIDHDFCSWQLDSHRKALSEDISDARKSANNLSILATNALALASYASVVDSESDEIASSLKIASEALFAHFRVAMRTSFPVECVLDGKTVRYSDRIDESKIEPTKWLNAYWLGLLFSDDAGLEHLCRFPISTIRKCEKPILFTKNIISHH